MIANRYIDQGNRSAEKLIKSLLGSLHCISETSLGGPFLAWYISALILLVVTDGVKA